MPATGIEPVKADFEKMAYLCGSPANPHRYAVFACHVFLIQSHIFDKITDF